MPLHWISFGLPTDKWPRTVKKVRDRKILISPLIPGRPDTYIYGTEDDYNVMLENSVFAYTWKKGGWDCYRHVEIIARGCIPLIPTIDVFPENSLAFHDKELYKEIWHICRPYIQKPKELQAIVDVHGQDWQNRCRAQWITTEKLFTEILTKFEDVRRIFWIDDALNDMYDYMSACVLIGLLDYTKGTEANFDLYICSKVPQVLMLEDQSKLTQPQIGHGKGFNYAKYFAGDKVKGIKIKADTFKFSELTHTDLVIYGSFTRSKKMFPEIARHTNAQIACVVGEDTFQHLSPEVFKRCHVFMREPTVHNVIESALFIPLKHLRPKKPFKPLSVGVVALSVVALGVILYLSL